jgi:hypothetical protein
MAPPRIGRKWGFFPYSLKNPSINASDVFPKDLLIMFCANFTCKGKECSNANCGFKHLTKAGKIPCKAILTIAAHFIAKDAGWFNEYHFMKVPNVEIKKLLGNSKGISSETARLV